MLSSVGRGEGATAPAPDRLVSAMSSDLPRRMRALLVKNHSGGARALELAEVALPVPAPGQVLVRVAFAPVNPNDLLALRGAYDVVKPVGSVAGFEGSGRVEGGAGWLPHLLLGRRARPPRNASAPAPLWAGPP